ncbi:hypothetical protein [Sporocytophaga myxococcoides]|uniref:hypothetical protein n=1 Tax=Sporocytophaga myxococcoides TaxID=153721 RepID=UPI00041B5E2C|nr:hypothetical protein [Sporocytophaga myxococcoides]
MEKNVSAAITAEELQSVISFIQQAEAILPFLISLSNEERHQLPKLGSKSVDFVNDSSETVKAFPNIMPPTFDKMEFVKDSDLVKALITIKMVLDSFHQKVDDTLMEVGSEAFSKALEVYAQVQFQKDSVPGLRSAYDKLKVRFARSKYKQKEDDQIVNN